MGFSSKIQSMSNQQLVLNIITPCTRPENLQRIGESIKYSQQFDQDIHIEWHIHVDRSVHNIIHNHCDLEFRKRDWVHLTRSHMTGMAGHVHRNSYLIQNEWRNRIEGPGVAAEWVMSLDDDNILHPYLIPWLAANKEFANQFGGLIFDQVHKNGDLRLKADPEIVTVGNIDTAQYMFRAGMAYGCRFDETKYDADGVFIEDLYQRYKDQFLIVNQPLCYYNYLRS